MAGRHHRADPPRKILATLKEILHLIPAAPRVHRAAEIAAVIDHPVYDCLCLAAEEARAPLVSDDQSLLTVAAGHGFATLPLG